VGEAMSYLKVGDWDIRANGTHGRLQISAIDDLGRVSGKVFDRRFSGWWNERGHRLTFVVDGATEDHSDDQAFSGYAWDEPPETAAGERTYRLAGSYDTFGGGGGAKDRQTFGWFATLDRPGPIHISER
jgi:hypothetical protein